MGDSLLKDLLQTGKYAVGYYGSDKKTLISRGIESLYPILLLLLGAWFIGNHIGFATQADLLRILGVTVLIGAVDLTLVLDFSLIFDLVIGDIFGILGLRNLITGLAILGISGPVVNYFKAIRSQ